MIAREDATIVYIEDDRASRVLVQRVLSGKGYDVHVASDGLEGISLVQETEPQLILMDMNLPSMDGREITTRLRGLPNFTNTPIVALTANTGPGSRELALASGCTGFLTKPIDVASFPGQVKDYLAGRIEPLSPDERNTHLQRHAQNMVERLESSIRELEAANRRLVELDRLKSDFIVLVSHELRTPLTLIGGYAHLLEDQIRSALGDSVSTQAIATISAGLRSGIDRMQEVVGEIISVSRISSGTLDLSVGPVRLSEVMESITADAEEVVTQRNLALHVSGMADLPLIDGDGRRLRTAIENVIGNAIKYTPDRGNIMVLGRQVDDDTIAIRIRDSGIGIPPEEHRHIFEQFYVIEAIEHHSTSKSAFQGGGLGIGLAITKGIVEAHNGRIWVESERRDPQGLPGSTFHILLPVKQPTRESNY
jgi:signal transduction histidine kinase